MNLPKGSSVRILFGSHAFKSGFVLGVPTTMESPDEFYSVLIRENGTFKAVCVPAGSLTTEKTFKRFLLGLGVIVAFLVAVVVLEMQR